MTEIKQLVRAGKQLQQVWLARETRARHDDQYVLDRLRERQQGWERAWRLLEKARRHQLDLIAPQLQGQLLARLQEVQDASSRLSKQLHHSTPAAPSLALLIAELQALAVEFDYLQIDWKDKFVSVATEPITLEGVELGSFAIQLYWQRLAHDVGSRCFDICALDPNPAVSNDLVTHPHVRDCKLCAGEATLPIQKALEEGRLADAFILIRSVLRHYNPSSPHVHLDHWFGNQCHDCSTSMSDDERSYCEGCSHDYCDDCASSCTTCSVTRCLGCLTLCAVCEDHFCSCCLKPSAHSRRDCCDDCLATCARCEAQVAKDELSADTNLCPSCQQSGLSSVDGSAAHALVPTPTTPIQQMETVHAISSAPR